jgi:hypothetical protein
VPDRVGIRLHTAALEALGASVISRSGGSESLDQSHPESLAVGDYFLETTHGALGLVNGPGPDLKRYRALESRATEVERGGGLES